MERIEKERVQLHLPIDLMRKLKILYKRDGPLNVKTKKVRPFSVYISKILWEHISRRYKVIDGLANIEEWDDSQFE